MKTKSIFKLGSLALAIAATSVGVNSAVLEEITVTAQKRAENLQDVPISMTALNGERMEEAGISSFSDLSSLVPNFEIAENAVNTIITMRGISVGSNQSFEQSVGVYTDGVHYGKSRQIRSGLFDLEQVEVLRGPQGILFGKNTLAGAVNVTTAEPVIGDPDNGALAISEERHDGTILEGNFNASLADNLAVRIAFRDHEADGYMDNGFSGSANSTMPTTDENIWRLSTIWQPNEDTTVKLKHTESDYVRLGGAATVTTFTPTQVLPDVDTLLYGTMGQVYPNVATDLAAGIVQPNRDSISYGGCALAASVNPSSTCADGTEKPEGTDTSTADTSLNVEIDLGNGFTFTSVTGINSYEYEDGIDADFLPLHFAGRSDISEYDQKSQEFRIASPTDQKFSFVTGAYITSSEQEIDRLIAIDGTLGLPALNMMAITGLGNPAEGTSSGLAFSRTDLAGASLLGLDQATIQGQMQFFGIDPMSADATNQLIEQIALTPAVTAQRGIEGATMFDKVGRLSNWKQETDSWAVFFQGTYQLQDDLSITAGLRYTEEDKKADASMDLTYAGADGYNGLATPSSNTGVATLMGVQFDSYAHHFNEERSTDHLIPAANLQWEQSDVNKYYLSYAEGFKSGGFNAVDDQNPELAADGSVTDPTVPGPGFEYEDETANSWEIGGKHTLLDGAMSLNWAYFDSDYDNQQVSTFDGLGFVVTNAASSNVSGLEVDIAWQATEKLRLGANLAMLDGKYDEFIGAACTAKQASHLQGLFNAKTITAESASGGCTPVVDAQGNVTDQFVQDLSGGQLGADYSGSLTADYEHPLSNGVVWFTSADYYFSDDRFLSGDNDPIDSQEAFETVNIRTGLRMDDWDVMIYGRNITDEIVTGGAADVPNASGSHFKYLQPGEVWGAKFNFRF
jgi:outer membrane receptor protein involved in Fe transport